jgi:cyclopropane-fatty-acyl-phospholipid synthase
MLDLYSNAASSVTARTCSNSAAAGILTLTLTERFPNSRITGVSNSAFQREFIEARARERGLANVRILTRDVNRLELDAASFDRCVSIEMFEHMRNYETLLGRIALWLRRAASFSCTSSPPRGLLSVRARRRPRLMARHFFTGGLMPSADTLLWFQRDLKIEEQPCAWHAHEKPPTTGLELDARRDTVLKTLPVPMATTDPGTSAGACSGWPAPSCSATATATNGWWRTTVSRKP